MNKIAWAPVAARLMDLQRFSRKVPSTGYDQENRVRHFILVSKMRF